MLSSVGVEFITDDGHSDTKYDPINDASIGYDEDLNYDKDTNDDDNDDGPD